MNEKRPVWLQQGHEEGEQGTDWRGAVSQQLPRTLSGLGKMLNSAETSLLILTTL